MVDIPLGAVDPFKNIIQQNWFTFTGTMTTEQTSILDRSTVYVQSIYDEHKNQPLFYHNWQHTEMVLAAAKDIISHTEAVDESEATCILLAVVFHDVGFTKDKDNHESISAEIAGNYLSDQGLETASIEHVQRLIMATQMGHSPIDLSEQIIRDADLAHLANEDYLSSTFIGLLKEINASREEPYSNEEWAKMCISFMEEHQYLSDYAKANYSAKKKQNLALIETMLKDESTSPPVRKKAKKKKRKSKKVANDKPEKGIETMFRVALRNHLNLSRIADNKANTLISVNGIIISIVISALFPKMDSNPFLIYPGISLTTFSILTIITAILSTIPKATGGVVTREQVGRKEGNLIFFGNFHNMSLDDYEWAVDELMNDKEYLYKNLTRDLYFLGKVLNRKYTLLRYSYYLFVTGLVVSIFFFFLSMRGIMA